MNEFNIGEIIVDEEIYIEDIEIDVIKLTPELEDLVVVPSGEEQNFKSTKYGYDNVTVKAVESEKIEIVPSTEEQVKTGLFSEVKVAGDENLVAENIKKDVDIFGVVGTGNVTDLKITNTYRLFEEGRRADYAQELVDICEGVTDMRYMFYKCKNITEINLSKFDTSNITSMASVFALAENLTKLDLTNFNTSNVTTMANLFDGCKKLKELDVSSFNTSNVTTMEYMFRYCGTSFLDVSNFDTSNVTNMNSMFNNMSTLNKLDLSNFDTSNVTDIASMFSYCPNLVELDISNFDFSNVKSARIAFGYSSNLKTIHFPKVMNTSKIKDFHEWFRLNNAIESIPELDMSSATNITDIFYSRNLINLGGCKNLGKAYTQTTSNYSAYRCILSNSIKVTHESLMNVINNLYDLNLTYDVANGGTLYTQQLRIGTTNLAKLTAEEIAIATNKGWTVS